MGYYINVPKFRRSLKFTIVIKATDILVNDDSRIPKYKQVVDSLISHIAKGNLPIGSKIPSINELSENLLLSRDTIEKAYSELKTKK